MDTLLLNGADVRENASIFAVHGDTKVRVASRETYEG